MNNSIQNDSKDITILEFPETRSLRLKMTVYPICLGLTILQLTLPFWTVSGDLTHNNNFPCSVPSFLHTSSPLHKPMPFPSLFKLRCYGWMIRRQTQRRRQQWKFSFFQKQYRRGGLSRTLQDLKFQSLNERNTQLTKWSTVEYISSALAKSLLSFHPFPPNNSCLLIPLLCCEEQNLPLTICFSFLPQSRSHYWWLADD